MSEEREDVDPRALTFAKKLAHLHKQGVDILSYFFESDTPAPPPPTKRKPAKRTTKRRRRVKPIVLTHQGFS